MWCVPVFHVTQGAHSFDRTLACEHETSRSEETTLWSNLADYAFGSPWLLRCAARLLLMRKRRARLFTRIAFFPLPVAPVPRQGRRRRRPRWLLALQHIVGIVWMAAWDARRALESLVRARTKDAVVRAMAADLFPPDIDHDVVVCFSLSRATLACLLARMVAAAPRAHTLTLFTHQRDLQHLHPLVQTHYLADDTVVFALRRSIVFLSRAN